MQELPYDDAFDAVINLQMLHIAQDPVAMLDEMERVLAPDGVLFMADIQRSWAGLFGKVFKSALTVEEAGALARRSNLRESAFASGLPQWRYEA